MPWTTPLRRLAGCLAALVLAGAFPFTLSAQTAKAADNPTPRTSTSRYRPSPFPKRAEEYYSVYWGVDSLSVKAVESGELIRFSFRVLDPVRAKAINDKKNEAFLYDLPRHLRLVIPSLEKVGALRQTGTPTAGRQYWMAFSNPHLTVKRGDRVTVSIGPFQASGLVIE